MTSESRRKNSPDFDRQQFFNFFEEFCWLLGSNKDINFKNVSKYLHEYRNIIVHGSSNDYINVQHSDEYHLIGILPSLLKDEELFQNNSQLVEFADEVLSLSISRWDKRSKNEIIGLIICEVEDANKRRLNILKERIKSILNNKNAVYEYKKNAKNTGNMFSWNETIQKLVGTVNE